jgi:hypothetical protein
MSRSVSARPRARLAGTAVLGLVASGGLISACSSSNADAVPAPTFSTGGGTAGTLQVSGAYIPQPASTSVAAAYFTIADSGAADALTGVTSDVSTDVGLHQTVDEGSTGTMVAVSSIAIPAHGTATLKPGGFHVMLMHPSTLNVGQQVRMTLHFQHAEPLTLRVPVVPLSSSGGGMGTMTMGSGS